MKILQNVEVGGNRINQGTTNKGLNKNDLVNKEQIDAITNTLESNSVNYDNLPLRELIENIDINTDNIKSLLYFDRTVVFNTEQGLKVLSNDDEYLFTLRLSNKYDEIVLLNENNLVYKESDSTKFFDIIKTSEKTINENDYELNFNTTSYNIQNVDNKKYIFYKIVDNELEVRICTFDENFETILTHSKHTIELNDVGNLNHSRLFLVGDYLFISNNGYCFYYDLVNKNIAIDGSNFYNKEFEFCYVGNEVLCYCENELFLVKQNGEERFEIELEQGVFDDVKIQKISKNLATIICNGVDETKYYVYDFINQKVVINKTTEHKITNLFDGLFCFDDTPKELFDYGLNEITIDEFYSIKSFGKTLYLVDEYNPSDYDLVTFGKTKTYVREQINDIDLYGGHFVKIVVENTQELTYLDYIKSVNGVMRFQTSNIDNVVIKDSWCEVNFLDGGNFFIPIKCWYNNGYVYVKDDANVLKTTSFNTLKIGYDLEITTKELLKLTLDCKTNGYKVCVIEDDILTQGTLNGYLTNYGLNFGDVVYATIDNYKDVMLENNCQILVKTSTDDELIDCDNLYLFTNNGNGSGTSNKLGSNKVFLVSYLENDVNRGSIGNNMMFVEPNGQQSESVSAFISAIKIAKIIKETTWSVDEIISEITKNIDYNINLGFGSIDYLFTINNINNSILNKIKANNFKFNKNLKSEDFSENSPIPRNLIFGADNDCTIISMLLKRPNFVEFVGTTFVQNQAYVCTELINGDDLSNLGFYNVGRVFYAQETLANNLTTSKIYRYDGDNNRIFSLVNYKDQIEDMYYSIDKDCWLVKCDTVVIISSGNNYLVDGELNINSDGYYELSNGAYIFMFAQNNIEIPFSMV